MRRLAGVVAVALVALASRAASQATQDAPAIARWVPPAPDPRHVFVMDSAHVLSDTTVRALQDSSRALQASTGADVVWVTLPSLGGRPIAEAGLYVGRTWKVGNAGEAGDAARNRGLVVLYVPDKSTAAGGANFRVEVGNGLEGTITDSRSRRISAAMRADLKAKRYDDAYAKGWAAAALLVRQDWSERQTRAATPGGAPAAAPAVPHVQERAPHTPGWAIGLIVALLLVLLVYMLVRMMRRRLPDAPPTIRLERDDDTTSSAAANLAALAAADAMFDALRRSPSSGDSGGFPGGGFDSGGSGGSDGGSLGGGGGFSGGGSDDSI